MTQVEIMLQVEMVVIGLIVTALVGGVIAWVKSKTRRFTEEVIAVKEGVRSLLKETVVSYYHTYHDELGYAPVHIKSLVTESHKQYDKLGGNGATNAIYEQFMKLPTAKPNTEHPKKFSS